MSASSACVAGSRLLAAMLDWLSLLGGRPALLQLEIAAGVLAQLLRRGHAAPRHVEGRISELAVALVAQHLRARRFRLEISLGHGSPPIEAKPLPASRRERVGLGAP